MLKSLRNKKAIEPVIATVLIIVITLVIVAIVIAFVLPLVQRLPQQAQLCADARLSIDQTRSCTSTTNTTIVVTRGVSERDVTVSNFTVILDSATSSSTFYATSALAQFQSQTIGTAFANAIAASVAPEVQVGSNTIQCEATLKVPLSQC